MGNFFDKTTRKCSPYTYKQKSLLHIKNMNKRKIFRAFTLIEMLIVIVIIGLLARAIIPRLTSARARANDTARKADLRQIATALTMYQMDKSNYPDGNAVSWETNSNSMKNLLKSYISTIPTDPKKSSVIGFWSTTSNGAYLYIHLFKWGLNYRWYALISNAETESSANRVIDPENGAWDPNGIWIYNYDFEDPGTYNSVELITPRLCTKVVKSNQRYNGWTGYCTYVEVADLQYVFLSP